MPKKPVGKLRLTVVTEWEVEDLEHYEAKTMQEAADLTRKQLDQGDVGFDEAVNWGDITSFKVEVVKKG